MSRPLGLCLAVVWFSTVCCVAEVGATRVAIASTQDAIQVDDPLSTPRFGGCQ